MRLRGPRPAPPRPRCTRAQAEAAGAGVDPAERVEQGAVAARIEQAAIVVLAVDLDQRGAELAQQPGGDRLVVDEGAAAAVGLDDAADDERLAGLVRRARSRRAAQAPDAPREARRSTLTDGLRLARREPGRCRRACRAPARARRAGSTCRRRSRRSARRARARNRGRAPRSATTSRIERPVSTTGPTARRPGEGRGLGSPAVSYPS